MIYIIKGFFVFGLLIGGTFFLLTGLGIQIPLITYKGLEAYNVPAGVILLIAGIALAAFWKVRSRKTVEFETVETNEYGEKTITKSKTKIDTTFNPPGL